MLRRHKAGVEVWLHSLLTSALDGGEWLVTFVPRPLYRQERTMVPTEQVAYICLRMYFVGGVVVSENEHLDQWRICASH